MKRFFLTAAAAALLAYFAGRHWFAAPSPGIHEARFQGPSPITGSSARGPATSRVVVSPDPVVAQRTEYYSITGSSELELYVAMREHGPKGAWGVPPGVSSDATTAWEVEWNAGYAAQPGSCSIQSLSVSVRIASVMPRWSGSVPGTPLAAAWERRLQGISAHEKVHAENGISAARAVRAQASVLGPAPSCGELTDRINATYNAVIDEYRKADRDFDWWESIGSPGAVAKTTTSSDPSPVPPPAAAAHTGMTDTERYRVVGTAQLQAEMAALAYTADHAGKAWQRFVTGCRGEKPIVARDGSGGRDWFVYAWSSARDKGLARDCPEARTFYVLADEVRKVMCMAEEKARRSYVYPGTVRHLQTKFHLEWDGWDRACR